MPTRSLSIALPALLLSGLLLAACDSASLRREALPYRFGQSMLGDATSAPKPKLRRHRPRRKRTRRARPARATAAQLAVARRARGLVGKTFADDRALVEAALASEQGARDKRRWSKRRAARPGDLVAFAVGAGKRKLGVVVATKGPRLTFVHRIGQRARLGWLHLEQPNRRRLPGAKRVANSFVRARRPDDPPGTRYLAGQLLRGFSSPRS